MVYTVKVKVVKVLSSTASLLSVTSTKADINTKTKLPANTISKKHFKVTLSLQWLKRKV